MIYKKYKMPILIAIVSLCICFCIGKSSVAEAKEKQESIYENIRKNENIVFLGDSITDWYPIEDIFGDLPIVRSGVAGYETDDILQRMDSMVYIYNPTKVFILIGTNDIKYSEDDEKRTADNIKKIIENIKKNRSKSNIYYQSIYPINRDMYAVEERYNDEIQEINNIMKDYCIKNNITYIDMYKELADENGDFNRKYTYDGLHPNELGYARISQVLSKYIYNIQ